MKEIEFWIDKEEVKNMYTADYWNNIEEDKKKVWWIKDPNDGKLINYLTKSGLKQEFEIALENSKIQGKILDLAAGTCWTSAIVSKYDSVEEIDAVEFSFHRINELAPSTVETLDGNPSKINRILGSFYNIKRENEYYDVIILSQAYHHAEFPLKLFHECDRVLKKDGYILIVGEHIIGFKHIIRRIIKNIFKGKFSFDVFKEFYNHDSPLGDHNYTLNDYRFTFYSYGYDYKLLKSQLRDSSVLVGKKNN